MGKLIFYDIPTKEPRECWSLNPWKTRLALNYKNIDYETKWIEYPDIAATMKALDVPPNDIPGHRPYTLPAVTFPDGTTVMLSHKIAPALEERYPSPPLHFDALQWRDVEMLRQKAISPSIPAWMCGVPRVFLAPPSKEYFERTRQEALGKPVAQIEAEGVSDEKWEESKAGWLEISKALREKGGPYLLGETPSYADLIIVGALHMFKMVDEDRLFNRVVGYDAALKALYDASKQWTERNDH